MYEYKILYIMLTNDINMSLDSWASCRRSVLLVVGMVQKSFYCFYSRRETWYVYRNW